MRDARHRRSTAGGACLPGHSVRLAPAFWAVVAQGGEHRPYASYLPMVFRLLVEGSAKEQIVQALVEIQTGAMGMHSGHGRADAAAGALLDWREWISEHSDWYEHGE